MFKYDLIYFQAFVFSKLKYDQYQWNSDLTEYKSIILIEQIVS